MQVVGVVIEINLHAALFVVEVVGLQLECDLYGLFVELDLFQEAEVAEGSFEVTVDHELGLFAAAKRHEGEGFELISDLVVHEHQQFLEHSRLVAQLVRFQQIRLIKSLLDLPLTTHL